MLEKIGAAEIDGLLVKSAQAIRELTTENVALRAQLATRAREDHAEKIASALVERGIMDESAGKEYARDLATSDKDLSIVEDLATRSVSGVPLGHTKVASVREDDPSADGDDVLTAFLKNFPTA